MLKNSKGQTMVEFALIITLFLAILFGIVEFGRAWYYSNHLGNSVRAAARYGAVLANSTSTGTGGFTVGVVKSRTATYATQEIRGFMTATPTQLPAPLVFVFHGTTQIDNSRPAEHGFTIRVNATYNMQILTGKIIPYFNTTKTIRRSASMPIE